MTEASEKTPTPQDSSVEKTPKISFDEKEAADFLARVWQGAGPCFAIARLGTGVIANHFCIDEWGGFDNTVSQAVNWVKTVFKPEATISFQVLPLKAKPASGRGTAKDVEEGGWLWADLDFKETVSVKEFDGCREGEDHALECYLEDGGRIIRVSRPPLKTLLEDVERAVGTRPTIVVDSGTGYHLYFKLDGTYSASKLSTLESRLVDVLGGDPQSKDLARLLRLPGTINQKAKRRVRVIYVSDSVLDPEKFLKKEQVEVSLASGLERPEAKLKELSDDVILDIVQTLEKYYRPGFRQMLLLYLSGWLAKAKVSPLSAFKIAKLLYEKTGDGDPLKTRLGAVAYSYRKAGIDLTQYARAIEEAVGVVPYGLGGEIEEGSIKGYSGIQELLEKLSSEEEALAVIQELSEKIGSVSPFADSIVELLDYEKQIYAIANLRKLIIIRARKEGRRMIYKEKVSVVAPTRVVVYESPIGEITQYEITFEGQYKRPFTIGPASIDQVIGRLKAEGVVLNSRLIQDVLIAIVQAFVRKGRAEFKKLEKPGFYYVGGQPTAVGQDVDKVDEEKLREALELLNELAETWFKHVKEKFATVVKWGLVAPFGFMIKQQHRGQFLPWLYLYGDSDTGKTTLAKIVLNIWGLPPSHLKSGAHINTVPRLRTVVSSTTYPIVINEPGEPLQKPDIVDNIKSAVENPSFGGVIENSVYKDYLALSCLLFTSNKYLPRDDSLVKRFAIIRFTYGEKVSQERKEEFEKKVVPRLQSLSEIGRATSLIILKKPELLSPDFINLGEIILTTLYRFAGLPVPDWIRLKHEIKEDVSEEVIETFTERLKKMVNDYAARYFHQVRVVEVESLSETVIDPDSLTFSQKLKLLLEKNALPGMFAKENKIYIKSHLLEQLGLKDVIGLKSLAEMLGEGFEYKVIKVDRRSAKVIETSFEAMERLFS